MCCLNKGDVLSRKNFAPEPLPFAAKKQGPFKAKLKEEAK